MNNQIKEEGLTDAYLLGKYDGIKQGRADGIEDCKKIAMEDCTSSCEYPFQPDCIECMCNKFDKLKE